MYVTIRLMGGAFPLSALAFQTPVNVVCQWARNVEFGFDLSVFAILLTNQLCLFLFLSWPRSCLFYY